MIRFMLKSSRTLRKPNGVANVIDDPRKYRLVLRFYIFAKPFVSKQGKSRCAESTLRPNFVALRLCDLSFVFKNRKGPSPPQERAPYEDNTSNAPVGRRQQTRTRRRWQILWRAIFSRPPFLYRWVWRSRPGNSEFPRGCSRCEFQTSLLSTVTSP
jgi:hypothetical protein